MMCELAYRLYLHLYLFPKKKWENKMKLEKPSCVDRSRVPCFHCAFRYRDSLVRYGYEVGAGSFSWVWNEFFPPNLLFSCTKKNILLVDIRYNTRKNAALNYVTCAIDKASCNKAMLIPLGCTQAQTRLNQGHKYMIGSHISNNVSPDEFKLIT